MSKGLVLFLSVLFILSLFAVVSAQSLEWEHTWGGGSDDWGWDVAVDGTGNAYLVGYTMSFGAGGADVFIAAFNTYGNLIWDRTWGGGSFEEGYGVTIDGNKIYVVGRTESFGAGGYDGFIAVFRKDGSLEWDRTWGGDSTDEIHDIALDKQGNIYVIGQTLSFTAGRSDIFIAKFDSGGGLSWDRRLGGSEYEYYGGITLDEHENIYIVGTTESYGVGGEDVFVAKLSPSGTLQWSLTWGTAGTADWGRGIVIDKRGNLYVVGKVSIGPLGNYDVFILKLDSDGNLIWSKIWGGSKGDDGRDIGVDKFGNIYVTGWTYSFGKGREGFLLRLNSDGRLLEQYVWGGDESDYLERMVVGDALYLAGYTWSSTRTLREVPGTLQSFTASTTTPSVDITDPTATVGDPSATITDPTANIDQVAGPEAAILKFSLPAPVGGTIITQPQPENKTHLTTVIAAAITVIIVTIVAGKRKQAR